VGLLARRAAPVTPCYRLRVYIGPAGRRPGFERWFLYVVQHSSWLVYFGALGAPAADLQCPPPSVRAACLCRADRSVLQDRSIQLFFSFFRKARQIQCNWNKLIGRRPACMCFQCAASSSPEPFEQGESDSGISIMSLKALFRLFPWQIWRSAFVITAQSNRKHCKPARQNEELSI